MTTMKFSTTLVLDEVTPTENIGKFEDTVRATFLPLTFLMLSTVVTTGMTSFRLTQDSGVIPFFPAPYVTSGNTTLVASTAIVTTATTATTMTLTTITTPPTTMTTSITTTTTAFFNASFYIKMEHSYPETTPSQAIIIL